MSTKKKLNYTEAIKELEDIVAKLQNNECEIDELTIYTERSLELLQFCKEKLHTTDQSLKKLLDQIN